MSRVINWTKLGDVQSAPDSPSWYPSCVGSFDGSGWADDVGLDLRTGQASFDEDWFSAVAEQRSALPTSLREMLAAAVSGRGPTAIHVTGLPRPRALPPTPTECRTARGLSGVNAEFWLALIGAELGELFSHVEICDGNLFHHIAPVRGEELAPTGESSRALLRMHTDGASHPLPPDFVLLWCHRGHHGVSTRVAALDDLLAATSPQDRALLRQSIWRHRHDYEFRHQVSPSGLTAPAPIVDDRGAFRTISVDFDFVLPPSDEARGVLERLEATTSQVAGGVPLAPGELMVIDNRRSVHARDAFQPRYDGTDRWLQSSYVRRRSVEPSDAVEFTGRVASMRAR